MRLLFLFLFFSQHLLARLPNGNWHAAIKINDTLELPFTFNSENNIITIHNGEEKIAVNEISFENDSIFIRMPVFDSEFRCLLNGNQLNGTFINHARKSGNIFPFYAVNGLAFRFTEKPERTSLNITGRYQVTFDGEDEESREAIGVFNQDGNHLTATFMTTTGDYRYLDGEINGNRLWLSAFDGSHLFMFTALVKGDSIYNGDFFSGKHWHDTWKGIKNENALLVNPDSLTKLKSPNEKISFTFPDENGKTISLSDKIFQKKAVIIQIMGTWCPNCMDETKFLSEFYNKNKKKDVEIIALDFERIADTTHAFHNIRRLKERFGIKYKILFAGPSDKSEAVKSLPMLNRIFAYPTMIFLNKKMKVIKIHTGFTGPATGIEYSNFQKDFFKTIDELKNHSCPR